MFHFSNESKLLVDNILNRPKRTVSAKVDAINQEKILLIKRQQLFVNCNLQTLTNVIVSAFHFSTAGVSVDHENIYWVLIQIAILNNAVTVKTIYNGHLHTEYTRNG
jgi:hypothetical protein